MPFALWYTYLAVISEIVAMERIYRVEDLHSRDPKLLRQRLQRAAAGRTVDRSTSEANLRLLAAGGFGDAIRVVEKQGRS